jgi:Secretion system C-terminal sorting domain/Carbohydrate binding domain
MKKFYFFLLTVFSLTGYQIIYAQSGPNLLGAKGTFSAPFITVNTHASSCTDGGTASYNPAGNIGNALNGCSSSGSALPCSGYTYVYKSGGLQPEFTYTIIKNVGDADGGNCIKGDWRGQDHTGDGGYFMAVNGAPNNTYSPIFYQIKSIPVCPGTQYEFSAYVLNILPSSSPYAADSSRPNISFKVITGKDTMLIGTSGPINYTATPTWVKVGGTFTPNDTTTSVDLQVVNATSVALGNDLGLDDISFNVVQSDIAVNGPANACEGSTVNVKYVVTDVTHTNTWYQWEISKDGGTTFTDTLGGAHQGAYIGDSMVLPLAIQNITSSMTGYKYRLVVSTSQAGLSNPTCTYFNDYTVLANACGLTPVTLTSFTGKYAEGVATLNWQTSQEFNSDHFEIEKSSDGQSFNYVANVKSAGNSSVITNYSYQDDSPNSGEYVYYRLKQVDIDGNYTYSSIIKLALGSNATMSVYPNPFNNNVNVSFSANKSGNASISVVNTSGQVIFYKTVLVTQGNNTIQLDNLPQMVPGLYFLSLKNDELNFTEKVQKQ